MPALGSSMIFFTFLRHVFYMAGFGGDRGSLSLWCRVWWHWDCYPPSIYYPFNDWDTGMSCPLLTLSWEEWNRHTGIYYYCWGPLTWIGAEHANRIQLCLPSLGGLTCVCPFCTPCHGLNAFPALKSHGLAWISSSKFESLVFMWICAKGIVKIFLCNSPCGILWSWNTPTNFLKPEVLVPNLHLACSKGFSGWVQNGEFNLQSPWSGQVPINGSFVCGWSGWRDNDWSTQCSKWTGCGAFPGWEVSIRTWVRYLTRFMFVWYFLYLYEKLKLEKRPIIPRTMNEKLSFPPTHCLCWFVT